ncbi:PREDICTED: uncharacterized protein LOC109158632 [Ipomoea nil]|uniref:uncharacterized protein LOC109158632 n=1 Tax=Ipomoea nil TaxID=35883 RepID=UPI000900F49A|nr:PREDICTED: uncharacterized protein LOC109158632 [Ipomoea nil]
MSDCKSLATPAAVSQPVAASDQPYDNPTQYRRLVGALQYLTITRPDLSYSVNRLCQFMHSPTVDHWVLLKRVLRYIKGMLDFGLRLTASDSTTVHAFSDSDWAGCQVDRKSTSGYAVFLGSNLISWLSRKQRTMARSSTEAEYKALADVSAEVTWVVSLLRELGLHSGEPAALWCDNLGATYLCANPVFHARTKHIEIDFTSFVTRLPPVSSGLTLCQPRIRLQTSSLNRCQARGLLLFVTSLMFFRTHLKLEGVC